MKNYYFSGSTPSMRCSLGWMTVVASVWAMSMAAAQTQSMTQAGTVSASPVQSAAAERSLYLAVGRQQTVTPDFTPGRIAIGNPAVLDVKVLRNTSKGAASDAQILLTGKGAGSTTMTLWPKQGGEPQQWNVQVASGSPLILERRLSSMQEHAGVRHYYQAGLPQDGALLDRSQIDVKSNTVQVDVQVVEFKKTAMKKVGLNLYSNDANDKGFSFGLYNPSTNGTQSPFADAMNLVMSFGKAFSGAGLRANLSLLEGNGLARVLARPTLVAHSGQSASFLAGGELPIPVSANDGNIAIEYKEFGVKLQLTPTVLSNERIALKVAPESSDLDFSNSVAVGGVAVPAIRTRRADTMVELADGESFVIGGLVSRSTSSNVNKVPVLGDLPILGSFFKNLSYSQEETELVIVVTPSLVHPLPVGTNLDLLMPGNKAERPQAGNVWRQHLMGGAASNGAMPGFSY